MKIKETIDKRKEDFIKDCYKKITEANKMCLEMNVPKIFSASEQVKIFLFIILEWNC